MKTILILFVLFPLAALAQPKELKLGNIFLEGNLEYQNLLYKENNVKTVTSWNQINDDIKSSVKTEEKLYDTEGRLTRETDYDISGKEYTVTSHIYDNFGNLVNRKIVEYLSDTISSVMNKVNSFDSKQRITLSKYTNNSVSGGGSITIFIYNDDSNSVSKYDYDKDSVLITKDIFYFNAEGFAIRAESPGTHKIYGTMNYFKDSVVIISYEDSKIASNQTWFFDKNNNVTQRKATFPGVGSYIAYLAEYKDNKKVLEKFENAGKDKWGEIKKYDNNENITEDNFYDETGKIGSRTLYKYNSKGLMKEMVTGGKNVTFDKNKTVYTYEFYK